MTDGPDLALAADLTAARELGLTMEQAVRLSGAYFALPPGPHIVTATVDNRPESPR